MITFMTSNRQLTFATVVVFALGCFGGCRPGPPDSNTTARSVRLRVERLQEMLGGKNAGSALTVLSGVDSNDWVLSESSLNMLSGMGLPGGMRSAFERALEAGRREEIRAQMGVLRRWSQEHDESTGSGKPVRKVESQWAVSAVCSVWTEKVVHGNADEDDARAFVLELRCLLEAYRTEAAERAIVLSHIGMIVDCDELRQMVDYDRIAGARRCDAEHVAPVMEWLARNMEFCFFHPEERRFHLDVEARNAATPSSQYRKRFPWTDGAGPRRTDPAKKWTM